MRTPPTMMPTLAVAVAATSWGLWWIPLRLIAERGLVGDWTTLVLYTVGTVIMLPLVFGRLDSLRRGGWPMLAIGFLSGFSLSTWSHAIMAGEVVRVALLFYLAPVWATLLAWLFLGERLSLLRVFSVALGLSGAVVVLGFTDGIPIPRTGPEWMSLMAGMVFALMATVARKYEGVGAFEKTLGNFVFAALTAGGLLLLMPQAAPSSAVLVAELPIVLVTAIVLLVPSCWLILWGTGRLDPGRVATLMLLEIVAASVSAPLLTDEPFGWRELGGCLLIIGAGSVEALAQYRQQPAAPATA